MSRRVLQDPAADAKAEIQHHIDERADDLVARGWDPEEARREAEARFGDTGRVRRQLIRIGHAGRVSATVLSLGADVRYALRGIRGNPVHALAVVCTLALGIGVATAVFAAGDALLLRPLPYQDVDRWAEVRVSTADGSSRVPPSVPQLAGLQSASEDVVDAWIPFLWAGVLARGDQGRAEGVDVLAVAHDAGGLLGIPLLMGRGFTPEDARPGAPSVAVLTSAYWDVHGRDPGLLGRTIRLDGEPVTVVGVLAPGRKFPPLSREIDVWVPFRSDYTYMNRGAGGLSGAWGRMAPEITHQAAGERLAALAANLPTEDPTQPTLEAGLTPVNGARGRPSTRRALLLLAFTVAAIFLIATVNGVNLVLVRARGRARELAMRLALGAPTTRLLRQLTVEGIVTGLIGGGAAVALAWGAVTAMQALLPETLSYSSPYRLTVEGRTLAFAFSAALVTGVVLGLLPGLGALRSASLGSLSAKARVGRRSGRWRRDGLVVAQIGLSMTLLVTAGLLLNSFARLMAVDLGVDAERLVIADLQASFTRYRDPADRVDFIRRLEEALEARPEIASVALASIPRGSGGDPLQAEGRPPPTVQPGTVPHTSVTPDYFETVGLQLLEGRPFAGSDVGTANAVVDIDLARFLWNGESPLGRRFRLGDGEWMTVVGVADDLKLFGRDERNGPYQFLLPRDLSTSGPYFEILMRTVGQPETVIPVFQRTLNAVDPEQSYFRARTATDWHGVVEEEPRFVTTLMGLLAIVAVALATVGLYGSQSEWVNQRRRELGVRMALGARGPRLTRTVLAQGMAMASVGIVLGLVGAVEATGLVERLLYGVPPRDPLTFIGAVILFLGVAALASYIPARRATRLDPTEVLRSE